MPSRAAWAAQFARIKGQSAQLETEKAEGRRLSSERNLAYQEQNLGTAQQVAGELGGESSDVVPYLGRYTLNEGAAAAIGIHAVTASRESLVKVNDLMDQAEAAARAGDSRLAAQLRSKAEAGTYGPETGPWLGVTDRSNISALFTFQEDAEAKGRSRLGSTMARTVGGLVKQGREFLDPESQTSRDYKRGLTLNADRAIASESRAAQRQARDIGLQHGAGRRGMAERDIAARTRETFARERAMVHQNADAQFQQFSRSFAADSVKLGQAWLQNQGEIRETFQAAMDNLANLSVTSSMQMADIEMTHSNAVRAARVSASNSKRQFWASVIDSYSGVVSASITG